uniref:Expansin n=1 Tax=Leersia perrieri TaxID=77586 RepID=A0A0D9W3C2_9ORYZ
MRNIFLQLLLAVVAALCFSPARSDWLSGTATFYGGADGSGTMGGACGYRNLYDQGYGINNTALSTALFNDGASCGQCYLIMCDNSRAPGWCKVGTAITVSATNLCPPNWDLPSDNGGWCNPPRPHSDMSHPAWENIGGEVLEVRRSEVHNQRVQLLRAGASDEHGRERVSRLHVSERIQHRWIQMTRNWGANWQCLAGLAGQALSFSVTSTGGQNIVFDNAVPAGWSFGQTFSTYHQFDY